MKVLRTGNSRFRHSDGIREALCMLEHTEQVDRIKQFT